MTGVTKIRAVIVSAPHWRWTLIALILITLLGRLLRWILPLLRQVLPLLLLRLFTFMLLRPWNRNLIPSENPVARFKALVAASVCPRRGLLPPCAVKNVPLLHVRGDSLSFFAPCNE